MTVKELRALLEKAPDDMPVIVRAEDFDKDVIIIGEITEAKIDEDHWGLAQRPYRIMFLIDAAKPES